MLIAQSFQNLDADGEFGAVPDRLGLPDAGAAAGHAFSPAYDKDKFENTAWTVNGKIGDLKAVYTGGYLVRHIDQQKDYTNYARSAGGMYYSAPVDGAPGCGLAAGTTPTLLLAGRLLARHGQQHAPEQRIPR